MCVSVLHDVCCDKPITSRVRDPSAAPSDTLMLALLPASAVMGFFKALEDTPLPSDPR